MFVIFATKKINYSSLTDESVDLKELKQYETGSLSNIYTCLYECIKSKKNNTRGETRPKQTINNDQLVYWPTTTIEIHLFSQFYHSSYNFQWIVKAGMAITSIARGN